MEKFKARVVENETGSYSLKFNVRDKTLNMPITQDSPNEIKEVFNELIIELKKGAFEFEIEEKEKADIIYSVAKEYVSQLNIELKDIYSELKGFDLTETVLNTGTDSK